MHLIIRVRNYFNLGGVHSIRIFMVGIAVNWYVSYHKNLSAKPDDHIGIVKYASFRSTDAIHKSLCIILVTFLIDSILKWGASTEVLNFFKFSIILYDPSFLGCIKILEKYPCPSCGDLTITPFFKSFSISKFIILKRIYNDTNMGHYPPLSYSDSLLDPSSLYPKWNYLI